MWSNFMIFTSDLSARSKVPEGFAVTPYEQKGAAEDRLAGASGCYQTPADGLSGQADGVGRRDPPEKRPERQRHQPTLAYTKVMLARVPGEAEVGDEKAEKDG
jgi:hypothetical protein